MTRTALLFDIVNVQNWTALVPPPPFWDAQRKRRPFVNLKFGFSFFAPEALWRCSRLVSGRAGFDSRLGPHFAPVVQSAETRRSDRRWWEFESPPEHHSSPSSPTAEAAASKAAHVRVRLPPRVPRPLSQMGRLRCHMSP